MPAPIDLQALRAEAVRLAIQGKDRPIDMGTLLKNAEIIFLYLKDGKVPQ